MDQNLIYAKTPTGDEAVRQSTRVVQRNLRMVLVQVDGKLSVGELTAKLGDANLVETALAELEKGGFIAPALAAASAWQESKLQMDRAKTPVARPAAAARPAPQRESSALSMASNFSVFNRPATPQPLPDQTIFEPLEELLPPPRPRRRISAGKLAGLFALVVLLAVVAAILFFPYGQIRSTFEDEMARAWQTPVRVGDVRLKVLPKPGLYFSNVRIGSQGESEINEIRIGSPFSLLGSGVHQLPPVEASGARISAAHLDNFFHSGIAQGGAFQKVILQQVNVSGLTIVSGPMTSWEMNGTLDFRNNSQVDHVTLQTTDRSLRIDAQPSMQGTTVKLEALAWRPSEASLLTFDSLQASGTFFGSKLQIQSFDARTLGGALQGNGTLEWNDRGVILTSNLGLQRIDARRMTTAFVPSLALDGDMTGNVRLRGVGADWLALWDGIEASMDIVVMRGAFHGVDLGEAARRGQGAPVRAGVTKFDRLAVRVNVDPRQVTGRDLVLNAGMFNATGQFLANRERQVDAALQVQMQTSVSTLSIPIRVGGTLPNLQAVSTR